MTSTLTTNIEYLKEEPLNMTVTLDIECNSTSTTSTNSPIISTKLLDFTSCPCNELISSTYNCSDCGQVDSFNIIKDIGIEFDTTRNRLREIKLENDILRHESIKLDKKSIELKSTLLNKQENIEILKENIQSLNHDLKILKSKCKEETTQVKMIQESKLNVEMELSELGEKLKQEADKLVVIEKQEQEQLRKVNEILEKDLKEATKQLDTVSNELIAIRNQIMKKEDPFTTLVDYVDIYTRSQVEIILMNGLDLGLFMDTLEDDSVLMEFNDFIQLLYKTPLRKLNSLKYMKYCIKDDIDPCLRFGPNPRLASKKILDSILVKSCFIEECPEGFVMEQSNRLLKEEATATMWERFTTSSVFIGCQACGRSTTELNYRFRISYFDEWACIDRYCRDRLLAVIEFYNFIRHLRAGAYKCRSLHELYQQSIRLKLQMFITRMGALPNMLQNCGIDIEKVATAFHGDDINNSIMLLSESTLAFERLSSSTESSITISTVDSTRTSASSSSFS